MEGHVVSLHAQVVCPRAFWRGKWGKIRWRLKGREAQRCSGRGPRPLNWTNRGSLTWIAPTYGSTFWGQRETTKCSRYSHHAHTVRATLPPSMLFADRALLCRGYSISEPNAWGETVSKPLGLTLGLVYNLSRLQLTRQSLHPIAKWEWHGCRCWPWWALQVIKRCIRCRSAVW